jgi:hypothetical protein
MRAAMRVVLLTSAAFAASNARKVRIQESPNLQESPMTTDSRELLEMPNVREAQLLVEQLERTMEDPELKEQVELATEEVTAMMEEPEVKELTEQLLDMVTDPEGVSQEKTLLVAEQIKELMAKPKVQQCAQRFSQLVRSSAATVPNSHASILADRLKATLASHQGNQQRNSPKEAFLKLLTSRNPELAAFAASGALSKARRASNPSMFDRKALIFDDTGTVEVREYTVPRPPIKLLTVIEKVKLLSALSESGLLSAAEEAGVLSFLEEKGAFSTAEKALPVIEKLGLLSFMQASLDYNAALLYTGANSLIFFAPVLAVLVAVGAIGRPEGLFIPIVLLGGLTTSSLGVAAWVWAFTVAIMQDTQSADL